MTTPLQTYLSAFSRWPGDPHDVPHTLEEDSRGNNLSVLSVYTALMTMGGRYPGGYGMLSGGGPYGRMGVSQDEFHWMIMASSWIDGYMAARPEEGLWFKAQVLSELQKRAPEALDAYSQNSIHDPSTVGAHEKGSGS